MLKRDYFIDDMCVKFKICMVKIKIDLENLILKYFLLKYDMKIWVCIDIMFRIFLFLDDFRWFVFSLLLVYFNF